MKRTFATVAILGCLASLNANADPVNWTLQSASSSLTISGALSSGGTFLAAVTSQTPGDGLTAHFQGTLATDNSNGLILTHPTPWTSIVFQGGTVSAINSGNWDPVVNLIAGLAPANYGFQVNLGFLGGANLAIRNLAGQLNSEVTPLIGVSPATQTFDANLDFLFSSGSTVMRPFGAIGAPLVDSPPYSFAGTTQSFLSQQGSIEYGVGGLSGVATLTVPVTWTMNIIAAGADTTTSADDIGVYTSFQGQFVGTAVVPEASSLVLLGLAGSIIGFVGYQRKSRTTTTT